MKQVFLYALSAGAAVGVIASVLGLMGISVSILDLVAGVLTVGTFWYTWVCQKQTGVLGLVGMLLVSLGGLVLALLFPVWGLVGFPNSNIVGTLATTAGITLLVGGVLYGVLTGLRNPSLRWVGYAFAVLSLTAFLCSFLPGKLGILTGLLIYVGLAVYGISLLRSSQPKVSQQ